MPTPRRKPRLGHPPLTTWVLGRIFWFAFLIIYFAPIVCGQTCPHGGIDYAAVEDETQHARGADVIFRSAAIAGDALTPTLRHLSKPGAPVDSVPGAAQVSLARLGDQGALKQLEQELNDTKSSSNAVRKLVRAGTDEAIAILMVFLRVHLNDNSLRHDFGDSSFDRRNQIAQSLSRQLRIGPVMPNGIFSSSFSDWANWWDQNKSKPVALSISSAFRDPYLQCLARKVEWGFPDAIFGMARTQDPGVVAVLNHLAEFGDKKRRYFNVATLQGRAQLGLAQLGDAEELQTIKRELDLPGYGTAIEELRLLGGAVAVTALIDTFDSKKFLPEYRESPGYLREANTRDQEIANALAKMVISPPETEPAADSKKIWKNWWARNRDTVQFVVSPSRNYE